MSVASGGAKFVLLYLYYGRLHCRPDDVPIQLSAGLGRVDSETHELLGLLGMELDPKRRNVGRTIDCYRVSATEESVCTPHGEVPV
jgi:hypothetical protein